MYDKSSEELLVCRSSVRAVEEAKKGRYVAGKRRRALCRDGNGVGRRPPIYYAALVDRRPGSSGSGGGLAWRVFEKQHTVPSGCAEIVDKDSPRPVGGQRRKGGVFCDVDVPLREIAWEPVLDARPDVAVRGGHILLHHQDRLCAS